MISATNNQNQTAITSTMVKVASALLKILREENESLEKGIVRNIRYTLDKKVETINEYNDVLESFFNFINKQTIDKNDKSLVKINDLMNQIKVENNKNESLLRINIEINDNIVSSFKNSHVQNIVNKAGYNSQGKVKSIEDVEKMTPAVSLNNKV